MSNPGQDVQAVYQQYQFALRQLQIYEQQEMMLVNQIEQYSGNLITLKGLQENGMKGEFIFPLSDVLLIKGTFPEIQEILVDVGSDYYMPTTMDDAETRLTGRIKQTREILEKISNDKAQLQALSSQLQAQISRLSQG
ncbi:MAG: hypothetical protein ACXAE3_13925 [Candidatus Kariarchaeaceae archaeon]|jgi:prefoldin alpha subunit